MLSLEDSRWSALHGGYRLPYDARTALRRLSVRWTDQAAWDELWNELHHQGDVGEASYAAVGVLAELARTASSRDWNVYALAATIETERHARENPPLPQWMTADYDQAWVVLTELAIRDLQLANDHSLIRSALAVVALGRGDVKLGAFLGNIDDSELDEYLDQHMNWSERYRADLRIVPPHG